MLNMAYTADEPPESWIRMYGNGLLSLCYAQLRDRSLAQDAVQETLLKAWHAWQKPNCHITSERAWLYRIAVNVCHDMQRSMWFRHVDKQAQIEDQPLAGGAEPEDGLLFMEVMRLPEKLRQAVVLYYYENMTMSEIAQVVGTNTVTIHRRLQKARSMLKIMIVEGEENAQ